MMILVVVALGAALLAPAAHADTLTRIRDTPFTIRVPSAGHEHVSHAEFRHVVDGLAMLERFARLHLGVSIRGATEVRLVGGEECLPGIRRPQWNVDGMSAGHTICLFAGAGFPQSAPQAEEVAAHEAVHVLQAELRCTTNDGHPMASWLTEGLAEDLAWRATYAPSDQDLLIGLAEEGMRGGLAPHGLRFYEARDDLSYPEAFRGALMADRGAPRRLIAVCRSVGRGTSWPSAFAAHTGWGIDAFYEAFAGVRARLAAGG